LLNDSSSTHERVQSSRQSFTGQGVTDFASVLDDFLDEEVVDNQGAAVGTLAFESAPQFDCADELDAPFERPSMNILTFKKTKTQKYETETAG